MMMICRSQKALVMSDIGLVVMFWAAAVTRNALSSHLVKPNAVQYLNFKFYHRIAESCMTGCELVSIWLVVVITVDRSVNSRDVSPRGLRAPESPY